MKVKVKKHKKMSAPVVTEQTERTGYVCVNIDMKRIIKNAMHSNSK